jgi:hypothetical protein
MSERVELDQLFGELTVHLDQDDNLVQVAGPAVPTAALRRTSPGAPRVVHPDRHPDHRRPRAAQAR